MTKKIEERPKYHPGEYVKDAIEALEMSSKEFSMRTGISERMLSGLISGKCNITFDLAYKLSNYFGSSIDIWTNLQNQYDIYLRRQENKQILLEDWNLLKNVKAYLLNLGLIDEKDDKEAIVEKTRKCLGVNELRLLNTKDLLVCFKQQNTVKENQYFYQNMWIALALNKARKNDDLTFDKNKLISRLKEIPSFTKERANIFYPKLKELFKECGVSFVLLPYLKNSYIYGVTKWLNRDNVMLAVSNRSERADTFWFTICHEIAHVLKEHKREAFISLNGKEDIEANKIAEDILIDRKKWEEFISINDFSKKSIKEFSNLVNVHPCIVLGRLQKEKKIPYGHKLEKDFLLSYKINLN